MGTEKQYVCVDVETTGLNPEHEEIVEVCARRFKEDGSLGKEFFQRCKPRNNFIPAEATAVHGITIDMVKDSPNYLLDGVQETLVNFIGERKVIGHNLIEFDLKFLKIKPMEIEDTLSICRARYNGGNALKKACIREGIKFDPSKGHGSQYDVEKTIELYLKLKNFPSVHVQQDMFNALPETKAVDMIAQQPEISNEEKMAAVKKMFTQPYSFSRINLFHQCPFKWKKRYIDKVHEPDQDALITGSVCHKVAQNTSVWCYRETFANKFSLYAIITKFANDALVINTKQYFNLMDESKQEITSKQLGYYLFENPKDIMQYTGFKGMSHFVHEMDAKIGESEYEKVSMPDLDTYNKIINETLRNFKVTDPDIIRDVELIMLRFYRAKDFSNKFGQIALVEKQLAFDKDWNYVSDWRSDSIFFRGILDIIEYYPEYVLITDYKTSRVMMTIEQLKRDMQLKIYLLLLYKFLPPESIKRVIVSIEYLRFGKTVEYEVENIEQMAQEACQWINDSIIDIENELMKESDKSFLPRRNEYCYCCYLGDNNICPLFNRKHINNINDIESFEVKTKEDCITAWKRVETNKKEIKNLTEKCKTFIKTSEQTVTIDETAKLDNYAKEIREYDSEKVVPLLLKKGLKMSDIIYYFSVSPTNMEKIINKNKLEISETEHNQISHLKIRHEFDACTEDEAKANDYMNA
jgi:DNA polymerase III epsilon subunit-like protein